MDKVLELLNKADELLSEIIHAESDSNRAKELRAAHQSVAAACMACNAIKQNAYWWGKQEVQEEGEQ